MQVTRQNIEVIQNELRENPLSEDECRFVSSTGFSVASAHTAVENMTLIAEITINGISYKFYYHASA